MSNLTLNDSPETFKEFYGRIIDTMPLLIGEGRVPLSMQGVMQARLASLNSDNDAFRSSWFNNY